MRLKQSKIKVIPDNFRNSNKRTIRKQLFRKGTDLMSFVIHQEDEKQKANRRKRVEAWQLSLIHRKLLNTKGNKPYKLHWSHLVNVSRKRFTPVIWWYLEHFGWLYLFPLLMDPLFTCAYLLTGRVCWTRFSLLDTQHTGMWRWCHQDDVVGTVQKLLHFL